ncbi:MAG: 4-hydroxy-tetrahydrodipicolinate synthase [Pseudonocardiales bacterium]|jgi:4-hydroxy-tetrahydrodipicolinate synthase|nr:4-hydroxy-tetrahydrodipicolinate synthase [Pseudonocardiales bacterium]
MDYPRASAKQAARESFAGLWAAMTTPFTASGGIDEQALVADVERLAGVLGVDGVFCTGVMGEFWALGGAERRRAVEVIVQASQGHFPVLAHTGSHSARDTIALTRHATEVGADFAVIINPYYPAGSEEGLQGWFMEVLDAVDIGVWLFDTSYSGVSLPLSLIDRLADVENVCGIKVGHDHAHYLDVLKLVGDRILVCEPNETVWLENMRDHGQTVFMSSAAPFLYQNATWQPMREYTQLALSGDYDRAAEVSATLDPVRELAIKWLHGRWARERINPVPCIKAWAGLLGMSGGTARPPLTPLTDAEHEELTSDLDKVGLL